MDIKESVFSVVIKPNSPKSELLRYDDALGAYILKIKAKPEHNKANIELIRFLSRLLNKDVRIISGLSSRKKLIKTAE